MAWIGAAIGGAASLIGGSMNSASASANNATQLQIASDTRNWETQMSNTAEQRHVSDLEAAGLNPALAYSTPAPVPSSAPMPNTQPTNPGTGLMQAGQNVQNYYQNSALQAQVAKTRADQANVEADTANKLAANPNTGTGGQATLSNVVAQTNQLKQQADLLAKQWDLTVENTAKVMQDNQFQRELFPLQLKGQQLDIQRQQLGMPKLMNEAAVQNSWWGRFSNYLPSFLQSGQVATSAAGLFK